MFVVGGKIEIGICLCLWSGLVGLEPGLAWHCYGQLLLIMAVVWIFLLFVIGFYCWRICGFVKFWLFLCVILVGFLDDFVANLVDLGCGNGGLWVVEVAVGCGWQWRWLGFWVCCSLKSSHKRERETNKVRWERNNKKLLKK